MTLSPHVAEFVGDEEGRIYKSVHTVHHAGLSLAVCFVVNLVYTFVPADIGEAVDVVGKLSPLRLHHDYSLEFGIHLLTLTPSSS